MKANNRNSKKTSCLSLIIILFIASTQTATAHEYWLDPVRADWMAGDTLKLDIRNGENFTGQALPLHPPSLAAAGLITPTQRLPLKGKSGNIPALKFPLQEPGLHLALLETQQRQVSYESADEFRQFLSEHNWQSIYVDHSNSKNVDDEIVETYKRYTKALVSVSSEPDSENTSSPDYHTALAYQGLQYELVALNPPQEVDRLSIRVMREGEPTPNRQVEWYHRGDDGVVNKGVIQTDSNGIATIVTEEPGNYLLNSVWVEKLPGQSAHWQSLWASLSFDKK